MLDHTFAIALPGFVVPEPEPPDPGPITAAPGDSFSEPTITAQDDENAALLAGLGYVADPQDDWTGQGWFISFNDSAFFFYWDGSSWQPQNV